MRARNSELPIVFRNVGFVAGTAVVLKDVTFSIIKGGPAVVVGPNGSGKTTLLKLAMGLIEPGSGVIDRGVLGGGLRRRAFVFQRPVMLRRTVGANVAFALRASGRSDCSERVGQLLTNVGLGDIGDRPARKLSGGEQQRLALAKAMAREPEVMFLDEPTASLDPAATKAVEEIIGLAAACGTKIVMATHDLPQARRLGAYILLLVNGRLVEHGPPCDFFEQPKSAEAKRFLAGELVT
jgi:tungstate transport system ATP-binding protein